MKILIAQLATETNTFAAFPSGLGAYEEYGIFHGDASRKAPTTSGDFLLFLRNLLEADGHEVVESLCAFCQPAGRTVRKVYEDLRDSLLSDLKAAMPVDAVQLFLHGAMVAEGYDDCEGDLIARVRAIVGPKVPIGVELDLHCHFTERMRTSADVIICFKEYPHIDGADRAKELYRILVDTAAGKVRPVTAVADCKMVGLWHTTREPMKGFVKRMQSFEGKDGVLSVSFGHGFPWGDVPEAGSKLWVVTDNDLPKAQALADKLMRELWALREATRAKVVSIDEAIDQALAIDGGPVVLGDGADNPGGGATGDSTFVLRRLLERGIGGVVIGAFWDLGAIAICESAGVGAVIDLRLGGKCGPLSGDPIDLRATVRAIVAEHSQGALEGRSPLGTGVWVEAANDVHILLASVRTQVFGTDAFTGLGITLDDKKIVVVKSTQHFHAQFAPIAKEVIYVTSPGALTSDFASIPYQARSLDYWPRVANPHGAWAEQA
jgi:microcystin degradation protein MlrC